jgi:hypothetical protein
VTADVHLLAGETKTSVAAVCRALEIARSSVYARRNRPPSRRAQDAALLDVEVTAVHQESQKRYGSPRAKAFRRTIQADAAHVPFPNLLNRQFGRAIPHEA